MESNNATACTIHSSVFFKMPPEVRLIVYNMLFKNHVVSATNKALSGLWEGRVYVLGPDETLPYNKLPELLRTCTAIYREGIHVLLRGTRRMFDGPELLADYCYDFWATGHDWQGLATINIRLNLDLSHPRSQISGVLWLLSKIPKVKKRIEIKTASNRTDRVQKLIDQVMKSSSSVVNIKFYLELMDEQKVAMEPILQNAKCDNITLSNLEYLDSGDEEDDDDPEEEDNPEGDDGV
ncbi:hypothetical protein FHETE_3516 [Fusarium heterosporum]|uniref:Uncharacterized protein n=1 Tax=Fusarium heterosporum TaxID=42747 RepID=A0A8H5TKZ0_FUSHE|nr:hypothetical protein FHETE_3516 [Fusarium heterosporum]